MEEPEAARWLLQEHGEAPQGGAGPAPGAPLLGRRDAVDGGAAGAGGGAAAVPFPSLLEHG